MSGKQKAIGILVLGLVMGGLLLGLAMAQEAPRIAKEDLRARLGDPDLIVLDVRTEGDWQASGRKIRGAIRENPSRFEAWADKYSKEKTLVLY